MFTCGVVLPLGFVSGVDPYVEEVEIPAAEVGRRDGCRRKEKLPEDREFRIAWMAPREEFHNLSASTSVGALKLALAAIIQHDYLYGWQIR